MRVIVIGGGPAGMMAAIRAAKGKNEVILLEKKERLRNKIINYIFHGFNEIGKSVNYIPNKYCIETMEDVEKLSNETWMVEKVYKKVNEKLKNFGGK